MDKLRPSTKNGFTLPELLITIAVISILATIALPSFRQYARSARLAAMSNNFLATINSARTEAIKRRATVILCPSNSDPDTALADTDFSCTTGSDGEGWADGWILYESEGLAVHEAFVPGRDTLIHAHTNNIGGAIDFQSNSNAVDFISFNPMGILNIVSSDTEQGIARITFCEDDHLDSGRVLEISLTGRPSVSSAKDRNNGCDPDGSAQGGG